jgi:hypothetical protein
MTTYASVRRRVVARLPDLDPTLTTEVLRTCVYLANAPDVQTAVLDLIADGRDIAVVEGVLGGLEATCPSELADLRALLQDTLTQPGATLQTVLAVVAQEFLAG